MAHADVARYREQRRREQNGRCYFCHLQLRDDCTAEHLKAKHYGGQDIYANIRASHSKCNVLVGTLPVREKVRLHKIGLEQGSDAFFLEVARVNPQKLSRKKQPQPQEKPKLRKELTKAEVFARIAAHERRIALRLGTPMPRSLEHLQTARKPQ